MAEGEQTKVIEEPSNADNILLILKGRAAKLTSEMGVSADKEGMILRNLTVSYLQGARFAEPAGFSKSATMKVLHDMVEKLRQDGVMEPRTADELMQKYGIHEMDIEVLRHREDREMGMRSLLTGQAQVEAMASVGRSALGGAKKLAGKARGVR